MREPTNPSDLSLGGIRVLLAEDNPIDSKLARVHLEKAGCSVRIAGNGAEAVKAHCAAPFDLILMDVQMPEMDGFEAARRIRAAEGTARHTPIVAMTAYSNEGDRERCLQAGMDGYLPKPVEPEDLLAVIVRCLHGAEATLPAVVEHGEAPIGEPEMCIDLVAALGRFGNDPDFFHQMLGEFLGNMPGRLSEMKAALQAGDGHSLARLAHNLKGMSATFAALRLVSLARKLEFMAREGDLSICPELLAEIEAEVPCLEQFLKA